MRAVRAAEERRVVYVDLKVSKDGFGGAAVSTRPSWDVELSAQGALSDAIEHGQVRGNDTHASSDSGPRVTVGFRFPDAPVVIATKLADGMQRLLKEYDYSNRNEKFGKGHRYAHPSSMTLVLGPTCCVLVHRSC